MNKLVFCFLLILGCQYVSAQDIALKDLTGLYLANISYVEKQMQAKGFKFEGVDGDENTIYSNSLDTSVVSEGFWYLLGWDGQEKITVSKTSNRIVYTCGNTSLFGILSELLVLGYKKKQVVDEDCFGETAYVFYGPKNVIRLKPINEYNFEIIIE
jgi:hypothetical protein